MRHNKDSIDHYFSHHVLVESRLIWIGSQHVTAEGLESGTDATMAEKLIKGLNLLQTGPKKDELITIQMINYGGSWHHGMAIFDSIKACTAPIKIEVLGICASMATVILQAADERVLHPGCRFLIHDGSDSFEGHSRNFEAWGNESKKLRQEMYKIYAERSGLPVGFWAKKCVIDCILSAEEAVRIGLADRVLPPAKDFKIPKKRSKKS